MTGNIKQVMILGHTINWWCTGAGTPVQELPQKVSNLISQAIQEGYDSNRYWLSTQGIHIEWEIVDWKSIADKLYDALTGLPNTEKSYSAQEIYEKNIHE